MLRPSNTYVAQPFFCAGDGFYAISDNTVTWNEYVFSGNIQQVMFRNGTWYFAVENDGIYANEIKVASIPENFTDASWPFFMFVGGVVNVETMEKVVYPGAVFGPGFTHVADGNLVQNGEILVSGEGENLVMLGATEKYAAVEVNGFVMLKKPDRFVVTQIPNVVDMSGELVASRDAIYTIDGDLIVECEPTYVFATP